ncbi:thioredoxin family protein [Litorilinea aerophila]|uniref:Glutaredoxin n=1 Tax=Litorilinea aerophila TaxID=1204385 RepID=A0A540VDU0_9CHLR|nr:thioredoxin family protein [Litorilinea aerophila]MCC9077420.1 thioredoxin family protein [Litorilinea aerophila]OUC06759.1 glutaredoxin [Litorilinea aerophila]GIV80046.1 MAG: glutaredoxin [Litorilinea sp.]
MALLNEDIQEQVRKEFEQLEGKVKLVVFTQEVECQYCQETRELVEEVAALSDKLTVEVYDFVADKEQAEAYGIDKIPAVAILADGDTPKDYGIRFYGIPSGYEFSTLIEDIVMVSRRESGLSEATRQKLAQLTEPLHLQVFVTPTCPYCPRAVRLAHMMALESDLVKADMVEAIEFPHLSARYNVMGVPRTVINDKEFIEGAVPEAMLMARIQEAVN